MEEMKCKDIIEMIYQAQEKILDEKKKQANKKTKEKIKEINVEKLLESTSKPNDLTKAFERIEENYSIKISQYNKEFYRQGFIDGVNLIMNCIKD